MNSSKKIIAKLHTAGFSMSDSNFNSLNILKDNNIYYTLCSHNIDTHGRIYKYNPVTDTVDLLADLGTVTGDAATRSLPHGKSHTPIIETDGKIYFATHYGFYQGNEGKEEPAPPPQGYNKYPGGKIMEYDKASGKFAILASAPLEEGILAMNMDVDRRIIYCLTWPKGILMYYDIDKEKLRTIGPVSRGGEVGLGDNYFCLCRMLAIDPRDGTVYFTNPDGEILKFHTDNDKVESVLWAHMGKDIFGLYDPSKGGHQGYNWRHIIWNPVFGKFYGVHGRSGYLFSFDPYNQDMEVLDRICNEKCKKNGVYEFFRYGYMTLAMEMDNCENLYYLSGFYEFRKPDAIQKQIALQQGFHDNSEECYHDIKSYISITTYHIPTGKYEDHGVIQLEDGRYPALTQTIAIHSNGRIYTCPWIPDAVGEDDERVSQHCDLISFENPLMK